jgi:Spy/CpxP family protein refolding chaperone
MQIPKKMQSARRAAALLALVLIPAGLVAQEPEGSKEREGHCMMEGMMGGGGMSGDMHGMMQDGMQGAGMMMGMAGGRAAMQTMHLQPLRVLSMREDLGLTPEQVTRLESLSPVERAPDQDPMRAMPSEHQRLEELLAAEQPDTAEVRAVAERLAALRGAMHAQMLTTAAAVRGILTPAQLEQALAAECPMMKGTEAERGGHGH